MEADKMGGLELSEIGYGLGLQIGFYVSTLSLEEREPFLDGIQTAIDELRKFKDAETPGDFIKLSENEDHGN